MTSSIPPLAQSPDAPGGDTSLRRAFRSLRVKIGLILLSLVILISVLGPFIAPHSPSEFVDTPLAGPSDAALLGTDYLGQDVLSRTLWGGWTVLWMSLSATSLAMLLGVSIGILAGFSRSFLLDELPMRILDVVLAIPGLVFVLLLVAMEGPKPWLIVLAVGIAFTPSVARITRGTTLQVVSTEFIQWAEVIGVPRRRILFYEILPNITTPIMIELGLRLRYSIGVIAAASFLGFGIQPPTADWGLMINENRLAMAAQPAAVLAPIVGIITFTLGTNLILEGVARSIAGVDKNRGRRV